MKKRLSSFCDSMIDQSDKMLGHWDITIGTILLPPIGFISFFFEPQIPIFIFVYLQYKFWSQVFFIVSLKIRKKDHTQFDITTISALIQMLDVIVLLSIIKLWRYLFKNKSLRLEII